MLLAEGVAVAGIREAVGLYIMVREEVGLLARLVLVIVEVLAKVRSEGKVLGQSGRYPRLVRSIMVLGPSCLGSFNYFIAVDLLGWQLASWLLLLQVRVTYLRL